MTQPEPETVPFDASKEPDLDLNSQEWAIWTFVDRTGAINLTLAQVLSRLHLHSRTVDGKVYYRPLAAAAEYITRPDQLVKRGRNELTDEYIDPFKVAAKWETVQAQLDAGIPPPQTSGSDSGGTAGDLDLDFRGWGH